MRQHRLLVLLGVSLVVLLIVVASMRGDGMGTHRMADGSTMTGAMTTATAGMGQDSDGSPMATTDMDLMFIDSMVPHHQSAIDMAEIALDQGEHDEIQQLAGDIIAAQQAEIDQLTTWRNEWFPGAPASGGMAGLGDMAGMDMSANDMQALREADPFDLAFIDEMIPHHESAIAMAKEILTTTERPEIRQLAEQIISAQESEIAQMRDWRATWYGP